MHSPFSLTYLGSEMHSTPPKPLTYCCVWMHAAAQLPFLLFSTESQVGNGSTVGRSRLNKYDQENLSQTCRQGHFSVSLVSVKFTINTNHHKGVMELALCSWVRFYKSLNITKNKKSIIQAHVLRAFLNCNPLQVFRYITFNSVHLGQINTVLNENIYSTPSLIMAILFSISVFNY